MKSKLRLLSVAALLAATGIGMVSCGVTADGGNSTTTSEATEPASNSDTRKFNIWLDTELSKQNGNIEIANGSRYLLWQHISVPDGTYTLEAKTSNITIDNHVIVATGLGSFRVQIKATSSTGKTATKVVSGVVISEEKSEFNDLWNNMAEENVYKAEGDAFSTVNHLGDDAYEFFYSTNSKTGADIYQGSVYSKDKGHWYTYQYTSTDTSKLTFDSGYGYSMDNFGVGAGLNDVATYSWKEITDTAGNGTGKFYLEDSFTTSGSYKYSDIVSALYDNIFGEMNNNYDTFCTRLAGATGIIATLDGDSIVITPCDDNKTEISTVTYGSTKYDLTVTLSEIGTLANTALDDWMKNPTYPTAVDVTSLTNAFSNIETKKNYTMTTTGTWVNPSTNYVTTTPSGASEYMEPYSSYTKVSGDLKVNVVSTVTSNQYNFLNGSGVDSMLTGSDYSLPTAGAVTATYISSAGKYSQCTGTMADDGTITYGTPVSATSSKITSLWGHKTYNDAPAIPLVSEGITDLLGYVSFSGTSTGSNGSIAYLYNTNGDDWNSEADTNYVIASWISGAVFGGMASWIYAEAEDYLALNVKELVSYLFGRSGSEFYFTNYLTVNDGEISLVEILAYSSSAYYVMETTWSDIGTTVLDSASNALIA